MAFGSISGDSDQLHQQLVRGEVGFVRGLFLIHGGRNIELSSVPQIVILDSKLIGKHVSSSLCHWYS